MTGWARGPILSRAVRALAGLGVIVSLSGCLQFKGHVTVHEDLSADIRVQFALSDLMIGMAQNNGVDPLAHVRNQAAGQGYTVANFQERDFTGLILTRRYTNVAELATDEILRTRERGQGRFAFQVDRGWFRDEVKLDMQMDFSDLDVGRLGFGAALLPSGRPEMDFAWTFPERFAVAHHNASRVSADGRTFTWDLALGSEHNTLQLDGTIHRVPAWLPQSGAGLAMILGGAAVGAALMWWNLRSGHPRSE